MSVYKMLVVIYSEAAVDITITYLHTEQAGTAAVASPPFRPSDPALCGSRPLVTPYYCRLEDLLC